jgi:serine/threonine protein kinase
MEKAFGHSILNHVIEYGPVSEEMAKDVVKKIIESVHYMHSKGVVHRDMNPTNVFIDKTDNDGKFIVKVLDFNVSKLIDESPSLSSTSTGVDTSTEESKIDAINSGNLLKKTTE